MNHNDFLRLTPGRWLNDEVINAYVGLLQKIETAGTLVLTGWFWTNVTSSTKADSAVLKVLKQLVSTYLIKVSTSVTCLCSSCS